MNEDVEAAAQIVQTEWEKGTSALSEKLQAVERCGSSAEGFRGKNALSRLTGAVQDQLSELQSLIVRMEFLAQQLPSEEDSEACVLMVEKWKDQYQAQRLSLRSATIKAKSNMARAAKDERELLLGSGEAATLRRRNLQTQAGMVAATESITDGLRRTRQMMVQEVERGVNTVQALDDSNITMRKAKDEYEGQRSLLNRTRHLLSSMNQSGIFDRLILIIGITFFLLACTYIILKRFGILRLARSLPPIYSTHVPIKSSSSKSAYEGDHVLDVYEGDLDF